MHMEEKEPERVLLFDGVCNLCNGVVQLVLKQDKRHIIKFAALQSPFGKATLERLHMNPEELETFVYTRAADTYVRSDAFLMLMRDLGGWFRLFEIGWIITRAIRNAIYKWVSRNRYRWFGKRAECYLPTPEIAARFID